MLDFLCDFLRALFYITAGLIFLLSIPFMVEHVQKHWDDPIYPYRGFSPECPTWEAPACAPAELYRREPANEVENTLPPTYSLAVDSEF